jgi:G3E family GTPase
MKALLPVTVISGFLGAGKTTLVNRILSAEQARRIAVLVNDFGAVNVDASLIESAEAGVLSLANGCVCCSLQSDLVAQLGALARETPVPFDHVVIETSGVSDPGQVVRALGYPQLRERIRICNVATVVDVTRFAGLEGPARHLADMQLLAADLAIVSKGDIAAPAAVAALHRECRRAGVRSLEAAAITAWWPVMFGARDERPASAATYVPLHSAADSPFESWMFAAAEPLDLKTVRRVLATLPHDVYRAKGYAYITDIPDARCVVQVVGDRVDLRNAGAWNGEPATLLVFVALRGSVDWQALDARLREGTPLAVGA